MLALKSLEASHTGAGANGVFRQGDDETWEVALDIRWFFKLPELMLGLATNFTHQDFIRGVTESGQGLKWRKFVST